MSSKRSVLLEWLDKHNAENIPNVYCLSVGFVTLIDGTHALYSVIENEHSQNNDRQTTASQQQHNEQEKQNQFEYSGFKAKSREE